MENRNSVFIAMNGGFGPLAQVMPLVDELKKHGIDIIFYNYRAAAELVKEMGFTLFEPPEEVIKPVKINPNGPEWWNADYLCSKYGFLDYEYTKYMVKVFADAMLYYKPKAVISVMYPVATIAAKILGLPLCSVTQACLHPKGKGGRTTWWKELPENLDRTSPVVNRILSEHGLQTIEKMEELNVCDLTIVPSIPEFDVIDSCDVLYTGLMYWQGPKEILGTTFEVERKNPYLIYAYTGHMSNSNGRGTGIILLEMILKAFNNTEFDVVVSTGTGQGGEIPEDLKTADNITITQWVSVNDFIPKCDIIIHHGGHGSCLQGLGHGVPSIVMPTMDEREYNARQLVEMGVGDFIHPDEITPQSLLQKAREIVANREMKDKATRLAQEIRNSNIDGVKEAARRILEMIQKAD